jgi:hypothetical protein
MPNPVPESADGDTKELMLLPVNIHSWSVFVIVSVMAVASILPLILIDLNTAPLAEEFLYTVVNSLDINAVDTFEVMFVYVVVMN